MPPARRALVIGIGDYAPAKALPTPVHDAALIARALRKIDPNITITMIDPLATDRTQLIRAIDTFAASVGRGEVAIVYFSGHGMESAGFNYLVPRTAGQAAAGDEPFEYIPLDYVLDAVGARRPAITVVLLDACRSNPFSGSASYDTEALALPADKQPADDDLNSDLPKDATSAGVSASAEVQTDSAMSMGGLAKLSAPPPGFIVGYAAAPGRSAYSLFNKDVGYPERGSIFTRYLVRNLVDLNRPIDRVFGATSDAVFGVTWEAQRPFLNTPSAGEVLLLPNENLARDEEDFWRRAVFQKSPAAQAEGIRQFVSMFPAGRYAQAGRDWLDARSNEQPLAPALDAPLVRDAGAPFLAGALILPGVQDTTSFAIATRDSNVRAAPWRDISQIIGTVRAGQQVRLLEANVRPGWAKVALENGLIGYVGSVYPQPLALEAAILTERLSGDGLAWAGQLQAPWRQALTRKGTRIRLTVGLSADFSPVRARGEAYHRALRLQSALEDQGVDPARIEFAVGAPDAQPGAISVTLVEAATQ